MMAKFRKLVWTEHSKIKMRQYGLSKQKLLGILYKPERKEQGIVPGTTAVMRTNKKFGNPAKTLKGILTGQSQSRPKARLVWKLKSAPGEIWLMYKDVKKKEVGNMNNIRKIISAWRYPGISKPGESIPIPEDIKRELLELI